MRRFFTVWLVPFIAVAIAICSLTANAATTTLDGVTLIDFDDLIGLYDTTWSNSVSLSDQNSSWDSVRWKAKNTATGSISSSLLSVPTAFRAGGTYEFDVALSTNGTTDTNYDCWCTDTGSKPGPPGQDHWTQDTNHIQITMPYDPRFS